MNEEYYDEEYDESSYDEYDDAYCEGYVDGLDDGLAEVAAYEDEDFDRYDEADYELDEQSEYLDTSSRGKEHHDAASAMLGAAMGYAAGKTMRGNGRMQAQREQEKMQRTEAQNSFYGCLVIMIIIVLCFVCC